MDRNELPLDPHHIRVPLGSKMISEPIVHMAQTMHVSCVKINTISKQTENELPLDPRHLGVPSGAPQNDIRAYCTFGANHVPILYRD
jgi:hypothetical protein